LNGWLAERFGFVLLEPRFLWFVLAVPLALLARRLTPPPSLAFAPERLLPRLGLPVSLRQRLRGLPLGMFATGIVLLALALARPAERVALPRQSLGVDLMLAVDRSSSMNEFDLDGERTRIEVVKDAATRFLEGRSGDRIGMLAFARYPDLLSAPTLRIETLIERLAELETVVVDGPEDLTGIGGAAARAAEILRRAPGSSRVLILLSDGEENVAGAHAPQALGPAEAAELCRAWGIRVHAIAAGAGTDAARSGLEVLAARTGGSFHHAADAGALDRIYRAIGEMEPSPLAEPEVRLRERGGWLAALSILLVAAGAFLARRGWEAGP